MTRPTAPPEPFEESAWWGASRSLDILTELDAVARVSGRAVEVVVTPFTPPPALKCDAAGRPVILLPGDTFRVDLSPRAGGGRPGGAPAPPIRSEGR